MMSISVKETAEVLRHLGIELIAGENGAQRIITGISVLEMPNANVFWLHGGEFVLSTFYAFDTTADIVNMIEISFKGGAAALAVHLGSNNKLLMDRSIVEVGNKYDFPIFLIPSAVPYSIIFSSLYEKMFTDEDFKLSKVEQIHNAAISALMEEDSIGFFAKSLANIIKVPIIIFDENFLPIAKSAPGKQGQYLLSTILNDDLSPHVQMFQTDTKGAMQNCVSLKTQINGNEYYQTVFQAIHQGACLGYIMIINPDTAYKSKENLRNLRAAGTALSIIYLEKIKGLRERTKAKNLFFMHMIESPDQPNDLFEKGKELGISLERYFAAIYVKPKYGSQEIQTKYNEKQILLRVEKAVNQIFTNHAYDFAVFTQESGIAIIVQSDTTDFFNKAKKSLQDIMRDIHCKVTGQGQDDGLNLFCGVGRPCKGFIGLNNSLQEARNAVYIGEKLRYSNKALFFEDMGVYSLFSPDMFAMIKNNCSGEYNILVSLCGKKHDVLLKTLEIFYDNNESIIATANAMLIHANTVKYRIDKLRELLDESYFGDGVNKLKCHLLLKICKVS
jgi:purine catabolism regulator